MTRQAAAPLSGGLLAVVLLCALCPSPARGEGAAASPGPVIGISFRGRHRAYPLGDFRRPAVLNDRIDLQEIAVFHNPEKGTSSAYFRAVLGEPIEFAGPVAGSVAEDLTTMTRWDMLSGKAVSGNLLGMGLVALPFTLTTWEEWFSSHPDSSVFSPDSR